MNGPGDVLYLSYSDVEKIGMRMSEVIDAVESSFVEKGAGRAEVPPKPGIHTQPDAFIHAMPAYIPRMEAAGMKWVSGYPDNHKLGLPYITGVLVLNDVRTGVPVCIMDCMWVTAMRTAAASAVAAKYLANPDSAELGILGAGVQGRSNLEALSLVLPGLRKVKAYDIRPDTLEAYVSEARPKYPFEVTAASSPMEAVVGSDVIITAGPILKHPDPVIEPSWVKPGALGIPLDFDSYWKDEALQAADHFVTDDVEQLDYYRTVGYFAGTPAAEGDMGDVVAGRIGRRSRDERIICMNLGLAIEDVATAIVLYKRALASGLGRVLPL
ncbi:MAG: ornithine cyclodeaminase family protein [Firmicutes bacterium]|jgi:ornithine cyclodeaminase/alanine dehydrogenase|nr:ornithine cyclodeaminase family protein [Bacillota bacterium]